MHFIDVRYTNQVDDYNNLIRGRHAMVVFYMDGCGYCELLKPEWNIFEEELKRKKDHKNKYDDYVIARVNANHINSIDGHNNVIGYPTIMHLIDGKLNEEYSDERNKESLIKFFNKMIKQKQRGGKQKNKPYSRIVNKNKSKSRKTQKGKKTSKIKKSPKIKDRTRKNKLNKGKK